MLIAAAPLWKLFTQKTRGAAVRAQLTELVNDELELGTDGCVRWDAVHRLGRSYRRSSGGDRGFCVIHVDPAEEVTRWV